jgi:MIP family channel proteins
MDDKNLRPYLAELIGTFALVLISAGAVIATQMVGGLKPVSVVIALAAGLIYAAALAFTLPLSQGYLNPAITIMFWVFKRMDGAKAAGMVGAQILGAVCGALLLRAILPYQEEAFSVTRFGTPHLLIGEFIASRDHFPLSDLLKGIAVEGVLTFILVATLFGTAIDSRAGKWLGPKGKDLSPVWLGIVLAAVTLVGFNFTGAAVNPARWLGPALTELTIEPLRQTHPLGDHPVYWIGPIMGALLAGWVYTSLLQIPEDQEIATSKPAAGSSKGPTGTLYRARK